jgi:hypothetical protein
MHQAEHGVGDEAVVDEEVLMDVEAGVEALEITGAIVGHAVSKGQVLRASRRPDGVGLHETEGIERVWQGCPWKEAPRNGVSAQFVDGQLPSLSGNEVAYPWSRRRRPGFVRPVSLS